MTNSIATQLQSLRQLIDFVEDYARQDAAFALRLEQMLGQSAPATPVKKARTPRKPKEPTPSVETAPIDLPVEAVAEKPVRTATKRATARKPKKPNPFEYVAEHGLDAFITHVGEVELDTLKLYAKKFIPRISAKMTEEQLRELVIDHMRQKMNIGMVFAEDN